jgi:perosamine synthetase
MNYTEEASLFSCQGDVLVSLLARPQVPAKAGVLMIVGGPQYRVGSHRLYVRMSRVLAQTGFAVLRFDFRGMADSEGSQRSFLNVKEDIAQAINHLHRQVPTLKEITLWGLCDGASAALLYCAGIHKEHVERLILLNPWVRSDASLATTQVKYYYLQRLISKAFWNKLIHGEVARTAIADFLIRLFKATVAYTSHNANNAQDSYPASFQDEMGESWARFKGEIALILSDNDFTAKEFMEYSNTNAFWKSAMKHPCLSQFQIQNADHTLSGNASFEKLAALTCDILSRNAASLKNVGPILRDKSVPRGPILNWSSFTVNDVPGIESFDKLKHTALTSSGRSAIYQALLQLQIPPGCMVLAPTYHSPAMIAPVILAKLTIGYYGLQSDGMPNLDTIAIATLKNTKAIIVSHNFGLPRSLAAVRQWCDQNHIALIEDCAHAYFGLAGDRPVGAWGDISTASLSKFFPVSEGGILGSASRPLIELSLKPVGLRLQVKGFLDVLEQTSRHQRIHGLNTIFRLLFKLKSTIQRKPVPRFDVDPSNEVEMIQQCDMSRVHHAPLWSSICLNAVLPRGRSILKRQQNFKFYESIFMNVEGAHPLFSDASNYAAPYVFPLWVNNANAVYQATREWGLPVFRWDKIWPGTPALEGDVGPSWNTHVLHLLCHQDLTRMDLEMTSRKILALL